MKKTPSLQRSLGLLLLCTLWLLPAARTQAQARVNPGESITLTSSIRAGGDDNGTKKFLGTVLRQASYGFDAARNRVEAYAYITAGVHTKAWANAWVENDFFLAGTVPRLVDATVTGEVEWRGIIGHLAGIGGANANVKISLQLLDEAGGVIGSSVVHSKEGSSDLDSFTDPLSFDNGSNHVSFAAKLTRGHTYRLRFLIECVADVGGLAVDTVSFFATVDAGPVPTGNKYARLKAATIRVDPDTVELLEALNAKVDTLNTRVNTLQTGVNTANTKLDGLQLSVNTANARLTSVESKVDLANNALNLANGKLDAAHNKLDARLDVAVSTRASQTSVNALTGKVEELAAALEAFKNLSVRAAIEAALVEGDRYNVTIYQVPAAAGGQLELVRNIVADSLEACRKAGLNNAALALAQAALSSGDQYFEAKGYKDAYEHYRAAYLHLSIVPGNYRP